MHNYYLGFANTVVNFHLKLNSAFGIEYGIEEFLNIEHFLKIKYYLNIE